MSSSILDPESIFAQAIEIPSADERAAFLAQACGNDADLRREVEKLVTDHFRAGSFLDEPAVATGVTVDAPVGEAPGTVIGPYKLLEPIGEGGMGTVWMAQQTAPMKRLVAVKLIKAGMDSKQVIARFEAERQALALMDHANIARVLDAGTSRAGRPYFVMDLVKGVAITRYCDEHHLTPRQRLELFIPICQAVQHAHQKGIIHRDLKPSNVLVALHDGKPVPTVIDFGVAKATGQSLTDRTLVTGFGNIVGTLEYMSPEQAEVNQLDIDTRSDIYSLGVLLYELLSGSPPFTRKEEGKAGVLEMLRVIREQEPTKPSAKLSTAEGLPTLAANRGTEPAKLTRLVRGELDWIVMRALEKDRNRRYETAIGLSRDVERYLADEPVAAGPPSPWYRFRKFARRNRGRVAVAAGVFLAVLMMAASVGWVLNDRANRAKSDSDQITQALGEGEDRLRNKQRPEARAAINKAGELLKGAGTDAQRERARELRNDLAMAETLEEIRLQHAGWTSGRYANARTDGRYARAFRNYGLDVDAMTPEEAAECIRSRTIRRDLEAALDDWAAMRWGLRFWTERELQGVRWRHPLAVARVSDDDEVRNRVRDVLARDDPAAVKELVATFAKGGAAADSLTAGLTVYLVDVLESAGEMPCGLPLLLAAQARQPDDLWLNFSLGMSMFRAGRPEEALRYLTATLALRPDTPSVLRIMGSVHFALGDHKEGVAALRKALDLDPNFVGALTTLGNHQVNVGDLVGALGHLRRAVELEPENAACYINLAEAHRGLADLNETIAGVVPPGFVVSSACFARVRLVEAITSLNSALALEPDDPIAPHNRGRIWQQLGELDQAVADLKRAVECEPAFVAAHMKLGLTLEQQGKLPEAADAYREADAARSRPWKRRVPGVGYRAAGYRPDLGRVRPAEPSYYLGRVLEKQKKWAEAEAAYRRAAAACNVPDGHPELEILADLQRAQRAAGMMLMNQRKFAEAERAFRDAMATFYKAAHLPATAREAMDLTHDLGRTFDCLSLALARQRKDDEAERALREATTHLPEHEAGRVHLRLGVRLLGEDKVPEAEAALRKAIRIDPRLTQAHVGLGHVMAMRGNQSEAARRFRAALEIEPSHAEAETSLGLALQQDGDFDRALVHLKQGYERLPHTHPNRALIAREIQNCTRLAELAERIPAVEKGEQPFANAAERVSLAEVCFLKKRYETAARLYEEGFAADRSLAEDWEAETRYSAARAAARAGGKWRKQALTWLRADLMLAYQMLREKPASASAVRERMNLWRLESALASVREPEALARLPAGERKAFEELWIEVQVLQFRAKLAMLPGKAERK